MALKPNVSASNLAIELDGVAAGPLRSLLPPSYRIDRASATWDGARVLQAGRTTLLGELAAEMSLTAGGPLLDWLNSLMAGKAQPTSGLLQVLDHNFNEKRRITFEDGQLSEIKLPLLSAADGKAPFVIGFRWQPARVSDGPGSGKVNKPVVNKRKAILASNFRVAGLPFDGSFITRVALPTVTAKLQSDGSRARPSRYLQVEHGELGLGFSPRSTPDVLAWVRKLVDDGRVSDGETLALTIDLLDSAMKTALATVTLVGCSLVACDEAPLGNAADSAAGVTLRFSVAQTSLTVAA